MSLAPDVSTLRDETAYSAAVEELGSLVLSEPDTPPGHRFDELVRMIEEYDALRGGYLLLPRRQRTESGHRLAERATEANPSAAPDSRAPACQAAGARAPRA